eukprot:9044631-Pyramimonas_sp.AAC.1
MARALDAGRLPRADRELRRQLGGDEAGKFDHSETAADSVTNVPWNGTHISLLALAVLHQSNLVRTYRFLSPRS